jgi:hypothetical protein
MDASSLAWKVVGTNEKALTPKQPKYGEGA